MTLRQTVPRAGAVSADVNSLRCLKSFVLKKCDVIFLRTVSIGHFIHMDDG